jgi:hypothetical protein
MIASCGFSWDGLKPAIFKNTCFSMRDEDFRETLLKLHPRNYG